MLACSLSDGMPHSQDIETRIRSALERARRIAAHFTPARIEMQYKERGDPVTEADRAINEVLRRSLVRDGEGWLSEETADDFDRLNKERVWIVDPIDGTREFVAGIAEWCISIGYIVENRTYAGGICNPQTGEIFIGSRHMGLSYNGRRAHPTRRTALDGALVLASRSEFSTGQWDTCDSGRFRIRPVGSVAYKLALVAAGKADATWTTMPKNEWDVAAGVALVESAGGQVWTMENAAPVFNRREPRFNGLAACGPQLREETHLISREAAVHAER